MVKYVPYNGYGFCSLCGMPNPKNALKYLGETRTVLIPTCTECFKEFGKKGGNTNAKQRRRNEERLTEDEVEPGGSEK